METFIMLHFTDEETESHKVTQQSQASHSGLFDLKT